MTQAKWTASQLLPQNGKMILITGANSGVGYQAALELARHGAHILLGVRNPSRGRDALQRLMREAPGATAELAEFDLASLESVRSFADSFLLRDQALDVLINNAGVMGFPDREVTVDGFERQFGTNHLGHFALTGLLLPALKRSAAARIVTVASLAHRNGTIEKNNLQSERSYDPMGAYNNTKLANLMFAFELDRRLRRAGTQVLSIAAHPGVAKTDIFQNGPGDRGNLKMKLTKFMASALAQNDAMGALPLEYAATVPGIKGGQYIGPDGLSEIKGHPTVVQPKARALDQGKARELWTESERLTGVVYA